MLNKLNKLYFFFGYISLYKTDNECREQSITLLLTSYIYILFINVHNIHYNCLFRRNWPLDIFDLGLVVAVSLILKQFWLRWEGFVFSFFHLVLIYLLRWVWGDMGIPLWHTGKLRCTRYSFISLTNMITRFDSKVLQWFQPSLRNIS